MSDSNLSAWILQYSNKILCKESYEKNNQVGIITSTSENYDSMEICDKTHLIIMFLTENAKLQINRYIADNQIDSIRYFKIILKSFHLTISPMLKYCEKLDIDLEESEKKSIGYLLLIDSMPMLAIQCCDIEVLEKVSEVNKENITFIMNEESISRITINMPYGSLEHLETDEQSFFTKIIEIPPIKKSQENTVFLLNNQ